MLVHLQLVASLLLLNLLLLTSVGLAFVGPASMAPGLCPAVAALLHYSLLHLDGPGGSASVQAAGPSLQHLHETLPAEAEPAGLG